MGISIALQPELLWHPVVQESAFSFSIFILLVVTYTLLHGCLNFSATSCFLLRLLINVGSGFKEQNVSTLELCWDVKES